MKKILKYCLILLCFLLLILAVRIGEFVYETEYQITDVATFLSEDHKFTVTFQMIGAPDWPFGDTTVRVKVLKLNENNKGELLETFTTKIADDGKSLSSNNCHVKWQSEKVIIILTGDEQKAATHEIILN